MKNNIRKGSISFIAILLLAANLFAQDELLFRKHIISSAWNGLYYGIALDIIAGIDDEKAAGLPIITAGGAALIPILLNSSRTIDYDALVLNGHGKSVGWIHGFSLATLIGGENAWNDNNYKATIAVGAISSIGLGILGKSIAQKNDWSEGRVELYRLYGWTIPYTGFALAATFTEEPRVFGATILLSGAGGYLLAEKINSMHNFTRGDVRAAQTLTLLNGMLGFGIAADIQDFDEFKKGSWLIPAVGLLSGSFIGHALTRNTQLTPRQGMFTTYAAAGGVIIGLGIDLVVGSESVTANYLIPYATGLGAYAILLSRFSKENITLGLNSTDNRGNFQISFTPQNLFINSKIGEKGYFINGNYVGMQPLISASLKF